MLGNEIQQVRGTRIRYYILLASSILVREGELNKNI